MAALETLTQQKLYKNLKAPQKTNTYTKKTSTQTRGDDYFGGKFKKHLTVVNNFQSNLQASNNAAILCFECEPNVQFSL